MHHAFISCVFITSFLHTGQSALIETEEAVWAAVGGQASLSCRLTEDKEVLQITWQKVLPDGEKNLASYTLKFGSRVSADLQEKMDFLYEDLQSCSMVIRKVTEQDQGCYRCLFNTYPRGALIGRTCLKLYELNEPVLNVRRSNSPSESVVSCSATGRPAPTVTLTVLQENLSFSHYNTTRVTNSNGTVTVTTTALLSASSSTQVGCSVSVFSAAPRELLVTVPGLTETSDGDLKEDSGFDYWEAAWGVAVGLVFFGAFFTIFYTVHQSRKLQMDEKPNEQTRNTRAVEDPGSEKNTEKQTSVLIHRQISRQPSSPLVTPTTPDIESCSPDGIKLHQKLSGKKSH